jgi:hypothetical protein
MEVAAWIEGSSWLRTPARAGSSYIAKWLHGHATIARLVSDRSSTQTIIANIGDLSFDN